MARIAAIAASVFTRHGADPATARRAGGWSNLTWLAAGLAIRIAADPGSEDLLREARLATLLPPEVGYPRVVESGVADGQAWMLAQEAPGVNLGLSAWPGLSWEQRTGALLELWQRAEAAHSTRGAETGRHARPTSPFYAPTPASAEAQLFPLEERGVLTPTQCATLRGALDRFWRALPLGHAVLNHGDLSTENALWHDDHVTCLLDFEFAVIAPVELDVSEMVDKLWGPCEEPEDLADASIVGRRHLRASVTHAVLPTLRDVGAADRLVGYTILRQLWSMNGWLAHWTDWDLGEDWTAWKHHRALTSLASDHGGYLAPVLTQIR